MVVREKIIPISVFALILIVALFLRVFEIGNRPLHNDEAVNWHFFNQTKAYSYYPYSNENYHGPSYFYLGTLTRSLGPEKTDPPELSIRVPAIISSILLVALCGMLWSSFGARLALLSATLLAFSPSLVYYGRYSIHESLLTAFSLLFGVAFFRWLSDRKLLDLLWAAAAAALMAATKETFVIMGFCAAVAAFFTFPLTDIWKTFRDKWGDINWGILLFGILTLLVFTGGFQWYGGIRELLMGIPQWVGRNASDTGHHKPFIYYARVLLHTEAQILILPYLAALSLCLGEGLSEKRRWAVVTAVLIAVSYCIHRFYLNQAVGLFVWLAMTAILPTLVILLVMKVRTTHLRPRAGAGATARQAESTESKSEVEKWFRYCAIWSLVAFLVYSILNYKTPWLIINITLPALLTIAALFEWLLQNKRVLLKFGVVLFAFSLWSSAVSIKAWVFDLPYGPKNPFSYVHPSKGLVDLVDAINDYRSKNGQVRVFIGVHHTWPLPFYFSYWDIIAHFKRDADIAKLIKTNNYDIIVVDRVIKEDFPGWARKYYRLTDVQESQVYIRR